MVAGVAPDRSTRGRLPAARRDRRPALAALAILLVLLGALGSALIAFRSGDRVSVLVASHDIQIGETVDRGDFVTASVAADGQFLVPDDQSGLVTDHVARVAVPKGTLVNAAMFTDAAQVPSGGQLVGIVVNTTQRPSEVPAPGDVVRVIYISGTSRESTQPNGVSPGRAIVQSARVVNVGSGGGVGARNVTVLVDDAVAGKVAEFASSGHIALTILPLATRPPLDMDRVG